jgi:catechol 2,3-dioxygenase-like lactoylglutathione lyase family enzyme
MWSDFAGLVIGVRDLAAAEAAYAALLGLRPSWSALPAGGGCVGSGFALANAHLELRAASGEGAEARGLRGWIAARGEGLCAVVLAGDDPLASARELGIQGLGAGGVPPPDGAGAASPFAAARRIPEAETRGIPVLVTGSASLAPRATPTGAATVVALDHVVLASRDPDASRAVWGGTLGLRLALDRRFEARGLRILFFRLGGVTVEITGPLAPEAGHPGPDAFFGAAWRVGAVDAARERLAAAGFDVSGVRAGHKPGTRVCTVRAGTHGVATLLVGPDPAGAAGPGSATLPSS